jgi:hypothetical protein
MVPGDILSKTDISPGAKLMFGRVRIFQGEIITAYVANDLGMSVDDAVKYLHELVRVKLVDESRLDKHTLFLLSSSSSSINIYSSYSSIIEANSVPKEEKKKEEFSKPLKEEEKKKKEEYFPPEEAAAKLRELKARLNMRKISAVGSDRISPDESRERQKRAMRSIVGGG